MFVYELYEYNDSLNQHFTDGTNCCRKRYTYTLLGYFRVLNTYI